MKHSLLLWLLLVVAYNQSFSQTVIYSYDFESDIAGQPAQDWIESSNVIAQNGSSDGQYLQPAANLKSQWILSSANVLTGTYTISFDLLAIKEADSAGYSNDTFTIRDNNGLTTSFSFFYHNTGGGSGTDRTLRKSGQSNSPLITSDWVHIDMVVDIDNDMASVSIDGTPWLTDVAFDNVATETIRVNTAIPIDNFQISVSSGVTWNGSWNPSAPGATDTVAINAAYNGASFEADYLTVNASGSLTIGPGVNITANDVFANKGTVTVQSGGSLITKDEVSSDMTYTGHITVEKTTTFDNSTGKYSVIGSPVDSATTNDLGTTVYKYDETVAYNSTGNDRFIEVTVAEGIRPGDAYFSAFTGSISFTGKPNTGDISVPLVYDEVNDGGATNAGFNLVSNPYPCAIGFTAFEAANADITGSIYLWDDGGSDVGQRSNSDYITVNDLGVASGGSTRSGDWDGNIRSAQGFFVKATTAGTLTFTDAMKTTGGNTDAGYFRTADKIEKVLLSISNNEYYSEILIGLKDDATTGIDRSYDAIKLKGNNNLQFFSYIDQDQYVIQGLPALAINQSVKLGFDAAYQDIYTIKLEGESLQNRKILLVDKKLNKIIDLSETPSYSFSSGIEENENRFNVNFVYETVLGAESKSDMMTWFADGRLHLIANGKLSKTRVNIYTMNGREVGNHVVDFSNDDQWSVPFTQSGLFIVKVSDGQKNYINKLIQR